MTDHDPLCPRHESGRDPVWGFGAAGECQCNQIARVRADERGRLNAGMEGYAREVRRKVLADLRAQVAEELPSARDDFSGPYTALEWVLALLGGESE